MLMNGLVASLLARAVGGRSLYICGGGPREGQDGGIHGNQQFARLGAPDPALERKLIRAVNCSDVVVTMGKRTIDFFQASGVRSTFAVIPGGVESLPDRGDCSASRMYDLIFVGRLGPVKRVDLFLEAVKHLRDRRPHTRAVVVGGGELEEPLRELAGDLEVGDQVTFAGQQTDVIPWLKKSRIFVLPSDSEGLSLALMEAVMCGLPAVVSDVGELRQLVVHGTNGYLVTARTGLAFCESIRLLLDDEALQARMSREALRMAEQFTVAGAANKWSGLLQQLR